MKNVLVIVDMQNDFVSKALANYKGEEVVKNIIKEINSGCYDFIALTRDSHFDNYLQTLEGKNLPIPHCIKNTTGWEIDSRIYQAVKDSLIEHKMYDKKTFGSFSLPFELDIYANEIKSITVVGLCTDICVVSNALILRAQLPNTEIYYVEEACSGTSEEKHKAALAVMESCQIYQKQ